MTGQAQIQVKAREIDFVTSFGKNIQALLDILGIARMIRKENNSVLKTKKVTGTLQSGDVGEGEEIPYSRYEVVETPFDTIRIEKYRKGVSLEAIAEKGYDAAVQSTDEEFKTDLQNVVMDKFYAQLKAGSLTGHESTWQMAVAMAIGKVKDKFKKMRRSATGTALWVNTLDVYKYVGAANITLQTAFGFEYMKNFLGAEVVFISSEIPENVVIATPLNNIIGYYVDPGDSDLQNQAWFIPQIQPQISSVSTLRALMSVQCRICLQSWDCGSSVSTWMRSPISLLAELIPRHWEN